jgi:hypothetical protein
MESRMFDHQLINSMRLLLLSICFTLAGLSSVAQEKISISGQVTDKESKKAIPGVHIWSPELSKGAYTSKQGQFVIKVPVDSSATLEFSSIGYKKKVVKLSELDMQTASDGNVILNVALEFDVIMMGGVEISTAPDTVFGSKEYHVADFCWKDEFMILLVFEKEQRWKKESESDITLYKNCALVLLDRFDHELHQLTLDVKALRFYTDFMDEIFLISQNKKQLVSVFDKRMYLSEVGEDDFKAFIEPVRDSIGGQLFVSSYNPDYPAFEYYTVNLEDSSIHTLRYIVDKPLLAMFRSEFKYLDNRGKLEAFRYEVQHGVDKEIVAGFMSGFPNSLYYESLYAPLFVHNDTITILDHYTDHLYKFDDSQNLLDSVAINYHKVDKKTQWDKKVIQDEESGRLYVVFKRGGWYLLGELNNSTGEIVKSFKIHYRYSENIRIKNGWAYYVYRPFESSQKKFLYKEEIWNNAEIPVSGM